MKREKPRQLFLDDGSCIDSNELTFLNHGYNADVWKWEHGGNVFAVKIFYGDCYGLSLHRDVASIFSKIHFYNFPNLYSTIHNGRFSLHSMDGYVMEFLDEDKDLSLLDISSIQLSSSLEKLERDIRAFSSKQVMMNDVRKNNTMITCDGMLHLFDYDMFYVDSDMDPKCVMLRNQHMVLWLVGNLLSSSILFDSSFSPDEKKQIDTFLKDFFSLRQNGKRLPSEVVKEFFLEETPRKTLKKII